MIAQYWDEAKDIEPFSWGWPWAFWSRFLVGGASRSGSGLVRVSIPGSRPTAPQARRTARESSPPRGSRAGPAPSGSARSSGNPRARTPGRRSRGLPDDLAGQVTCSRPGRNPVPAPARGTDSHERTGASRRRLRTGADPASGAGPKAVRGRTRLAQCEPSATKSTPPPSALPARTRISFLLL